MKKVLLDARMVSEIPHGIAKYVEGIAQGFLQMKSELGFEPVFLLSEKGPILSKPWSEFSVVTASSPFLSPKEWVEIPKILDQEKIDLYHSTSLSALPFCPVPHVLTLHDLNHLHFGGLDKKIYYNTVLKKFARSARALMTVSEFSRTEIAEWLGMDAAKISVTYNSFDPPADADVKLLAGYGIQHEKFFFTLSGTKSHKNLGALLEAYSLYREQAGAGAMPLVMTAQTQSTPGVIGLGSVSDPILLQTLISQSRGFFFPSLYEGFGRPPVEAAIAGARLAVSDIPPHREGLSMLLPAQVRWVQPKDIADWARAFHDLSEGRVERVSGDISSKLLSAYSSLSLAREVVKAYQPL